MKRTISPGKKRRVCMMGMSGIVAYGKALPRRTQTRTEGHGSKLYGPYLQNRVSPFVPVLSVVLPLRLLPLTPQKRQRGLGKARRVSAEHRAVSPVGHHPQMRARDGGVQIERKAHRVEKVAIAEHDQRPRGDGSELGRREAHVIVIGGERLDVGEQRADLFLAVCVALPERGALRGRTRVLGVPR